MDICMVIVSMQRIEKVYKKLRMDICIDVMSMQEIQIMLASH